MATFGWTRMLRTISAGVGRSMLRVKIFLTALSRLARLPCLRWERRGSRGSGFARILATEEGEIGSISGWAAFAQSMGWLRGAGKFGLPLLQFKKGHGSLFRIARAQAQWTFSCWATVDRKLAAIPSQANRRVAQLVRALP